MKNILVATDLSPAFERTLGRAARLAARTGTGIRVLQVVDASRPEDIAATIRVRAEQDIRTRIQAMLGPAGRDVNVQLVIGDPLTEILNRARTPKADLLVVGTHRKAPLSDLFRGTTVERFLRWGDIPTLVVKDDPAGPYRRVLIATASPSRLVAR